MNFNQFSFIPGVIISFGLIVFIVYLFERRFFKFVKTYWFYKRSFSSFFATLFFLIGSGGLLFSLLDVRGPEQKIKMNIPSDRTIILIDTSASMLAEDVKPSRLQKAVLVAKHFARKATGHQLSVVAFAEIQKKIVPFTNDIDLIDSRLESLKSLRNHYGSSALSVAIQESVQYFRETGDESVGNILVITDGEETAEGLKLNVPKGIHIALVGVGTEQGGRIPLDDSRGFRFGYKKNRAQDVITKLNESFFKDVASELPSAKYWLTNSYSLPSEEIIDFFKTQKTKGDEQQDMVIKPVLMEWVVVPSLVFLILSYLFKMLKTFAIILLFVSFQGQAQEQAEVELSKEIQNEIRELQNGNLTRQEKLKLADELRKAGAKDEAMSLFEETLPKNIEDDVPKEAYLNYGTTLLEKGKVDEALDIFTDLSHSLGDTKEDQVLKEVISKNILSHFKNEEQKKKEKQNKKENKDQKKDDKDNQSGQGSEQKSQNGGSQGKDQKKNKEQSKDDKKDKEKKDENQNEGDKEDNPKEDLDKNDNEKKEGEKKPLPPKKIPAKLKQLMSDDRQLQMKMIENGTRELNKRKSRTSKDW